MVLGLLAWLAGQLGSSPSLSLLLALIDVMSIVLFLICLQLSRMCRNVLQLDDVS